MGDLVVKVGGAVVWDRCHLNVTTIIKNLSTQDKVRTTVSMMYNTRYIIDQVDITVLRHTGHVADLSVKPVTHYPLLLDDMVRHYR